MSDDFSEEPCRMDRRDRWMIVFLVLIFASYCWFTQWRAFGYWADPVIYVEGARSLVEQGMYRHESHAGTPKISLYPPIQSAWLSIPWRLNPSFPENVPWLNGSMIVLACGTLAVGFVFLRRAGLPVGLCAGLTFNWAISASWNAFIYWLSSDIGFTGWCVGLGLLWLTPKLSTNTRWWLTGIGLALGYWWRSAALGLIAGTGLVTLWIAIRHRRFLPLIAITVPVLVAGLGWKQLAGPGPGYASIWKVLIADMGGWGGYALNFFSNLFQL